MRHVKSRNFMAPLILSEAGYFFWGLASKSQTSCRPILLQRHPPVVTITPTEKLHQLHQQFAPRGQGMRL